MLHINYGNIVVLSEIVANNKGKKNFYNIDRLFTEINDSDWAQLQPDILISYGGAPVSRLAKTLLRKCKGIEHWRIGNENSVIDTFQNLTLNIEISPSIFFNIISKEVRCIGEYYNAWQSISNKANASLTLDIHLYNSIKKFFIRVDYWVSRSELTVITT